MKLSEGTVHRLPKDLKSALLKNKATISKWEDITPLARNEWICWTISPKLQSTRDEHVKRVINELNEGIRRPCCWIGCIHRNDKSLSPSIKFIIKNKNI